MAKGGKKPKMRGERLDGFIAALFPRWAERRALARLRLEAINHRRALASTYAAAEHNRLTADWSTRNTSADGAIVADLGTLIARARSAVRDDWAAAAIVSGWRRHVVGTGFSVRSNARDPWSGKPFTEFNKAADRLFARWCRARFCDLERKKNFHAFQSLMQSEKVTVGEAFIAIRVAGEDPRRRRARVPRIILQAFEVEQLDTTIVQNPDTGDEIRNGIEVDRYGAPVAYWVYTDCHPLDASLAINAARGGAQSVRIPAEDVCHLARWDRPRQTHGVSRLAPILKKLRHLQMYDEYQLVAARLEACYGAAIEIDPNAPNTVWGAAPAAGESTTDERGNSVSEFEPGMFQRLNPGEKVSWHDPSRPGELYDPFVRAQVSQASTGAGLDYTTVVRDFTGGTYSGQRQGMIERDYEICPEQEDLIDMACIEVRAAVITAAILEGLLEAPGFAESVELAEAYLEADWRPQAKPWIDPANHASASDTALRNRLTTRRTILNELGEDWRETLQQLADEEEEMRRLGLSADDAGMEGQRDRGKEGRENAAAAGARDEGGGER